MNDTGAAPISGPRSKRSHLDPIELPACSVLAQRFPLTASLFAANLSACSTAWRGIALRHSMAELRTIHFGGPKAMSMPQVVEGFEKIGGQPFHLEHIPE